MRDYSIEMLGTDLARESLAIFVDSSVFDDCIDQQRLWAPILGGHAEVMLVSDVLGESIDWLLERPSHPLIQAIASRHPRVMDAGKQLDELDWLAMQYYLALLLVRRFPIRMMVAAQERETGRPLDETQRNAIHATLQRELGNRAVKIARKASAPGVYTDERLVFLAVEHALRTGQQTVILTQDTDVEEQFFKILWLLETHYRSMLLARVYLRNFPAFRPRPVPRTQLTDQLFTGNNNIWFDRDPGLRFVLPRHFRFVAISVIRLGDYLSQLSFGAEQEMREVLRTKGATRGLSTMDLGGRNIHASLGVVDAAGDGKDAAGVVYDRRLHASGSTMSVAWLDVIQALYCGERHRSLVATPPGLARLPTPYEQPFGSWQRAGSPVAPEAIRCGRLWLPYGATMP